MSDGGDRMNIGDWHIPTVVAIAFWSASALAVAGFTLAAFRATGGGADSLDASPPGKGEVKDPSQYIGMLPEIDRDNPKRAFQAAGDPDLIAKLPRLPAVGNLRAPFGSIQQPKSSGRRFVPSPDAPK